MPCDYSKYPSNWSEIRKRILERDNHCCKVCGINNYAVVRWDKENKTWERARGNIHIDRYGDGDVSYQEARELVKHWNENHDKDDAGWVVIVLTIMHLDHDTTNNIDKNLATGCQRCHNNYDRKYRSANARKTLQKKKGLQSLF